MVNIPTIKYIVDSMVKACCTKNELAWKACECLASKDNDIDLGRMAALFGIERFRVSRTNTIFAGGSTEMVKAYKDGAVPLNVAYKIVRMPVAQRDKALAEYLAAPKGKHGRRNPKPGLVRGSPNRAVDRCISKICVHMDALIRVLDQEDFVISTEQALIIGDLKLTLLRLLKRHARANMEANV